MLTCMLIWAVLAYAYANVYANSRLNINGTSVGVLLAVRLLVRVQPGESLSLDDLVFTNHEGNPVDPSYLTHTFAKIVKQAELGGVRFHDLRHTFASLALLRGAKPKVISEALGHASIAFTMDTYSHIISGMQEDMMALLDDVLPAGKRGVDDKMIRLISTLNRLYRSLFSVSLLMAYWHLFSLSPDL